LAYPPTSLGVPQGDGEAGPGLPPGKAGQGLGIPGRWKFLDPGHPAWHKKAKRIAMEFAGPRLWRGDNSYWQCR